MGYTKSFHLTPSRVKHNLLSRILPILCLRPRRPVPTLTQAQAQHALLPKRSAVPAPLGKFELRGARVSADLYKAIRQAKGRAKSGKLEF